MNELPKELRTKADDIEAEKKFIWGSETELMRKAADTIEALRAENEALRNAFNDICSCHTNSEYNKALSKIRALIKSQSAKGE